MFRWFNDPPRAVGAVMALVNPLLRPAGTHAADHRRARRAVLDPARCLLADLRGSVRGGNSGLPARQRDEGRRRSRPPARLPVGRALSRLSDRPARHRLPVEPHGGRSRRRRRRLAVAQPNVAGPGCCHRRIDQLEPHVRRRSFPPRHPRRGRRRLRVRRDRARRRPAAVAAEHPDDRLSGDDESGRAPPGPVTPDGDDPADVEPRIASKLTPAIPMGTTASS